VNVACQDSGERCKEKEAENNREEIGGEGEGEKFPPLSPPSLALFPLRSSPRAVLATILTSRRG